ncbi:MULTISPECIES: hypothetical protein [unclassified Mesorhizobium]|uniref:hypothetical protein n=1 Tax=unclassified Mesorhizobium TaxID=325217 RepID=UPI001FD87F37|nr:MULTISPECIES: hypothetical protein [unclassified Mesorhizobium]
MNDLRSTLDGAAVDLLAARLNQPGRDRLAIMWEVVVLHALASCGSLQSEVALPTGRRPDAAFNNDDVRFVADITTVSDEGLDDKNPFFDLLDLIEKEKNRLGLPIGGLDLQAKSKDHRSARGIQTVLRLPPRKRLPEFVRNEIVPRMRDQIRTGEKVLRIAIDSDDVGLEITIDPEKSPYSGGGYALYDAPTIKDRNPLFYAMKAKVEQLRGAEGITGVIVCDGDCAAFSDRGAYSKYVSATAIAQEFLRQYSSIDFVLLLTIRETRQSRWEIKPPERWVHHLLVVRKGFHGQDQLEALFAAVIGKLPKPIALPVNGAFRARESGYHLGHHGGFQMEGGKIRISSRELMEIMAGLRTIDDNGAMNVGASRNEPPHANPAKNVFLWNLQRGQLPVTVEVIKTGEDDSDDWIEFEFGDRDPAISPLK